MSTSAATLLVVDTSAIAHYIRQNPTGIKVGEELALDVRPQRPLLCSVVEGELLALARYWGWGADKSRALEALLRELVRVDVGLPEVVEAYADLHYASLVSGRPTGDNDLWIAATAKATGAHVVTCDRDFLWLAPEHITVHYIPETR